MCFSLCKPAFSRACIEAALLTKTSAQIRFNSLVVRHKSTIARMLSGAMPFPRYEGAMR